MVNISFIILKGNVTDNYKKSLKNWKNKMVNWSDMKKVVGNSSIQYSCYEWDKGIKSSKFFKRDKQDCIILDIDDGMSIQGFVNMFKKYEFIIATTKSHQQMKQGKVCDRFRVIMKAINISSNDDIYFRSISLIAPMNDKQTLTSTASFLGTSDCLVIYNDGKKLDMFKANELAEKQLKDEYVEKIVIPKELRIQHSGNGYDLQKIKDSLDVDTIRCVLASCGYVFDSIGKFSLREERTSSCKIYPSGYIVDYGGDTKTDIFGVLMEHQGMSFPEAVRYVNNFI